MAMILLCPQQNSRNASFRLFPPPPLLLKMTFSFYPTPEQRTVNTSLFMCAVDILVVEVEKQLYNRYVYYNAYAYAFLSLFPLFTVR